MEKIGIALHMAKSGRLIIKVDREARTGQFIFEKSGHKVAKVAEVIGPTRSPYISALPISDRVNRVVGKEVFISGDDRRDRKKW